MSQALYESQSNQVKSRNAFGIIIPIVIILLIIVSAWLLYRVYQLEKSLEIQASQITTLNGELTSMESRINSLASDLDYVIPLAENANNYAHSHFSDSQLKTDITGIPNALSNVLALRGVRFNWNTDDFPNLSLSNKPQYGFIAQEVERVYPELVSAATNGYKMVDYDKLTPILVEAIKEQQIMIDLLQQRVSTLEKQR